MRMDISLHFFSPISLFYLIPLNYVVFFLCTFIYITMVIKYSVIFTMPQFSYHTLEELLGIFVGC